MMKRRVGLCFGLVMLITGATAQQKPRVPVGVDPGGLRVALIGTGLDYTDFAVRSKLARDGEGTLISVDFLQRDFVAYEPSGPRLGTLFAQDLLRRRPHVALIVARVLDEQGQSSETTETFLRGALTFPPIAQARLALVTSAALRPACAAGQTLEAVATQLLQWRAAAVRSAGETSGLLVVVPACAPDPVGEVRVAVIADRINYLAVAPVGAMPNAPLPIADLAVLLVGDQALQFMGERPDRSSPMIATQLSSHFQRSSSKGLRQ